MNKEKFSTYLQQPDLMNESSLPELRKLVSDYPYFSVGRILLLRNLHSVNDSDYEKELQQTAIYAGNRALLFNYIFHKRKTIQETPELSSEEITEQEKLTQESISLETVKTPLEQPTALPEMISETVEKPALTKDVSEISDSMDENTVHSFSQWLDIMSHKRETSPEKPKKQQKRWDLIDNFIHESPKLAKTAPDKASNKEHLNLANMSVEQHEEFMTETLAKIYLKQKHYQKAIQIFQKLSLKYPEKSIYFAGQIKIVNQLLQNEK